MAECRNPAPMLLRLTSMTAPEQPTPTPPARSLRPWLLPLAATALVVAFGLRQVGAVRGALREQLEGRTTVTHDIVVEQVRAVAKLVTSETTVRDVVTYENTRLGSTKRSIVVATGRVLAGMDLQAPPGADVQIDDAARRITIVLPPASVLAVDILGLRTYDEQRGLWNPFEPEDRDAIYARVRIQLRRAAQELNLTEHANRSATQLLQTMLGVNGYTVDVRFRAPPPVQAPAPRG